LASMDRIVSTDAAAYIRSYAPWDQSGIASTWRGTGAVGVYADFNFAGGNSNQTDARSEDQEILAELIAPIALDQAQRISKDLIHSFGTLPRVLAAFESGAQPSILPANVSNHLRTLKQLISRLLRRDVSQDPILSSTDGLLAYLHNEMSHLERETLRVLFLDANNRLIYEKIMWEGTLTAVQCHPREIICLALQRNASALIIVHNHPSGDPRPSASDITVTRELNHAASYLGIIVHDHIIISRGGHVSMRAEGMLDKEQKYAQNDDLENGPDQPFGAMFFTDIMSKLLAFLR
jgi:DNA repair protein RadC